MSKIDKYQAKIIASWIKKNLENCNNPRFYGKALIDDKKEYWSYRVGTYRIIAEIKDAEVIIHIVNVGHRQDI